MNTKSQDPPERVLRPPTRCANCRTTRAVCPTLTSRHPGRQLGEQGQKPWASGRGRTAPKVLQVTLTQSCCTGVRCAGCLPPPSSLPSLPLCLVPPQPSHPASRTALRMPAGHSELAGWLGLESWPPHLLAVCVWVVSYLTYLGFLICEIHVITAPSSQPHREA